MLGRVRGNYERPSGGGDPHRTRDFSSTDRAWGLMPLPEYADAVVETFARDYTPRFAALDIRIQPRATGASG
jgi:hypothetical protein